MTPLSATKRCRSRARSSKRGAGGGHPGAGAGIRGAPSIIRLRGVFVGAAARAGAVGVSAVRPGDRAVRAAVRRGYPRHAIKLAMAAGVAADVGDGRTAVLAALLGCALLVAAALRWPAFEHRSMS